MTHERAKVQQGSCAWPAERFYWAEIEAPAWRRRGPLPAGLLAELADEIPAPIDEVHAVGTPDGRGRLLVCAAPRRVLAGVLEGGAVLALTPASLPPCTEAEVRPDELQLLTGPFEPLPRRAARRRKRLVVGCTLLLCAALVCVGLARRASVWNEQASEARLARSAMLQAAAPDIRPDAIAFEIERLRAAVEAASGVSGPAEAAPVLAAVLGAWPAVEHAAAQSIAVTGESVNLAVAVDGDPAEFLAAFSPPGGWRADDPRLNAVGGITRLQIRLRPAPGETPAEEAEGGR